MPCDVLQRIQQVLREQGPEIIALLLQYIYIQLGFSPKAAKLLIREQGVESPDMLRVLADKNVDDICNVMSKPGGKNAHVMPYKGQQVSVIVQENLKLASFIFHHRWREMHLCLRSYGSEWGHSVSVSRQEETQRQVKRPQRAA